ncbi:MAG: biotin--[acetyl-CoA-carboxylase] ligase [Actinomycetota bacterium]|nr:biotin--[acetyl-CoA-carboxylase] ligase [Actinomycetota bacterium]
MSDSPLPVAVVPRLRGRLGRELRFVARCPSTQRLLPPDAPEGAVATTDYQTAGRGRLGREWLAPPGTSVLCSVVLRPEVESARLPGLSLVAGRACAEAIRDVTGLEPAIKPPNDVLLSGRKVAGILAEASDGRVVLGIGVNVHQSVDGLPAGTDPPATSLRVDTGAAVDRRDLLVALLERLERHYEAWLASAQRHAPVDE